MGGCQLPYTMPENRISKFPLLSFHHTMIKVCETNLPLLLTSPNLEGEKVGGLDGRSDWEAILTDVKQLLSKDKDLGFRDHTHPITEPSKLWGASLLTLLLPKAFAHSQSYIVTLEQGPMGCPGEVQISTKARQKSLHLLQEAHSVEQFHITLNMYHME